MLTQNRGGRRESRPVGLVGPWLVCLWLNKNDAVCSRKEPQLGWSVREVSEGSQSLRAAPLSSRTSQLSICRNSYFSTFVFVGFKSAGSS